jgi:prepilin-type N-terminal cleavage/methylation domain-containing protein
MSRLRETKGFTLIEVLLASTLSLLVMGASLAAFDGLQGNHRLTQKTNDAQDVARRQTDRLARELRNLASPSQLTSDLSAQPQAVDLASAYDFVFRIVADTKPAGSLNVANVKRVRYCVNNTNPSNEVVWRQTQTWTTAATPALPSTAACPGTGWDAGSNAKYITNLVNRYNGQNRPVFGFNSTDVLRITKVRTTLYVDLDPTKRPAEVRLSSGVFLRNQNRIPTADFTATVTADKRLVLNGSGSDDPEGMALTYQWYLDAPSPLPDCSATPAPASCLGQGVVFEKTGLSGGGSHTVTLAVKDPAGLAGIATQTVTFPN